MAIEPVKIPQNVYIEDRIVGPLTLRQLLMVGAGGGFSYILFATLQKTYGTVSIPVTVLAWIPCAISALFAFVRINDLSLLRICFLMLERTQKPSVRTWTPRRGIAINFRSGTTPPSPAQKDTPVAPVKKTEERIRELSSFVDRASEPVAEDREQLIAETLDEAMDTVTETHSPEETIPVKETPATFPVIKGKVTADDPAAGGPVFSDLSVFRDVFPSSSSTWQ